MIRKISLLALLLTLAAIGAPISPASATDKYFHVESSPALLVSSPKEKFVLTTAAGTVTCGSTTFSGTMNVSTSTQLTLSPNYDNCNAFGFINVPVHENGCSYIYTADYTYSLETSPGKTDQLMFSAPTHLECSAGKSIEITTPFCTTKIGPQTVGSSAFWNWFPSDKENHIGIEEKTTGLTYNECGTVRNDGKWSGHIKIHAFDEGGEVEMWYE